VSSALERVLNRRSLRHVAQVSPGTLVDVDTHLLDGTVCEANLDDLRVLTIGLVKVHSAVRHIAEAQHGRGATERPSVAAANQVQIDVLIVDLRRWVLEDPAF